MSEEKRPQPEEATSPSRHPPRPATKGQQRRNQHSVFQYITILFAAAFILLLFTFAMERRQYQQEQNQNQEQIDALQKDSSSALQRLNDLLAERDQLKEQAEALEEEVDQLTSENAQAAAITDRQQKALEAMDWFWRIQRLYSRGNQRAARELADGFEASGLEEYLPEVSPADPEGNSPKEQYQELYELLF